MNYLGYIEADEATRLLVCQANINVVVNNAYRTLIKKVDDVNAQAIDYSGKLNISEDEREHIESCISFILQIIGKHSNSRFGETAEEQHRFFRRKYEQETFFKHLFIAVQEHKKLNLTRQSDLSQAEINKNYLVPFWDGVPEKLHTALKQENRLFKIKNAEINETQIYAAAVFYYANFLIQALRENDAIRLSQIYAMLIHFTRSRNYNAAHSQVGVQKKQSTNEQKKARALKLFKEEEIQQNYGPKRTAMAAALKDACKRHKIKCSEETIRTNWIPEFINKS